MGIACDVVEEDSVRHLVTQAASLGGIDVWVNNAGILRTKSLADATLADFRDLIDAHVQGSWLGIKHVAPTMRACGGGSIITMSSIGGKAGLAGQTNYSTAQAAIVGLTKAAEIGSAAVFLASDMSSYMTGALLEVSGGRFMERPPRGIP